MSNRRLSAAAALAGLVLSASAPAAAATCYTPAEVRGLVSFMAAPMMRSVAEICDARLPASAFMRSPGFAALGRDYAALGEREWPNAKAGMLKVMASDGSDIGVIDDIKDSSLRDLVDVGFAQAIAEDVKPADCPAVDELLESFAKVPPEAAVRLVTAMFAFDKSGAPFPLCEAR